MLGPSIFRSEPRPDMDIIQPNTSFCKGNMRASNFLKACCVEIAATTIKKKQTKILQCFASIYFWDGFGLEYRSNILWGGGEFPLFQLLMRPDFI